LGGEARFRPVPRVIQSQRARRQANLVILVSTSRTISVNGTTSATSSFSFSRGGQPFRPLHGFRPLILPPLSLGLLICPQVLRAIGAKVDVCAVFSPDIPGVLEPLALTFLFPRHLGYMFSLVPTGEPETGPSNQLFERC
jgi:hypothetical protein